MKEDIRKLIVMGIYLVVGFYLIWTETNVFNTFLIGAMIIYCLWAGAYSRGRNWFIGWDRVTVLEDKVK